MPDPCSALAATKICASLFNGFVSPYIQEAFSLHTHEALLVKLNQLKEKVEAARDKLVSLKGQANGTATLKKDALQWKKDAEVTLRRLDKKIKDLESSIEATCASGCFPDCSRRHAARKSIREEDEKVDDLIKKYRPLVKGVMKAVNDTVRSTRSEDIRKIWECVSQRDEVKVVCIHGIAGVGKKAVAEAVCNEALLDDKEIFDYVIWMDADYGIQLKSLQEKIMKRLDIKLIDTDDDKDRATKIRDEFVRRKKCLVIIVSLWEDFTLQDIGIPEEEAEAGVVCKVVLTSRSRLTCRRIPKDEYFEIKPLSEGWEFFQRSLGRSLPSLDGEAEDLMKKAVENCEGLPSEIIVLAHHMRGMDGHSKSEIVSSLKEMLSSRTRSAPSTDNQLKTLEYSYEKLPSSTHQNCFLYCALYPKGYPIEAEQLIENWIWEGLLNNYIGSLDQKRRDGRNVLTLLKSARLLEKVDSGSTKEAVKMLSKLHDMAVNIMFERRLGVLINAGNDLTDFPPIDDPNGGIQHASFMYNKLGVLREQPNCPNLSTLLLHHNPIDFFSDNFFTRVPNLKLLDLSYTNIVNLPSSFCSLKYLQMLRLRHCLSFRSLPSLSNLKELIVLDLFGTPLAELPSGMERLKKLKRLDLSHTKLAKFPAGLISALESLQELLLMMNDAEAYSWRSKQTRSYSREAFVEELACLDGLRVLQLNFFNKVVFNEYLKALPSTMPRPRALRFKFCVGGFNTNGNLGENSIAFIDGYPVDIQLPVGTLELYLSQCRYSLNPNNTLEKTGIDFQNLKVLTLFDCSGLTYLFSFEMLHCLQNLERISVRQCWSVLGIIKRTESSNSDPNTVFSCRLLKLKEIVMIDLLKLESIYPGNEELEWPAFRRFSVWNCDNLERLPSIVNKVGEHPKRIELRGQVRLDDSPYFEYEEADIPEDTVSFVSTKKPESTPQLMSNDDQAIYYRRETTERNRTAAIMSENGGIATPPQSPGYIVRRLDNFASLVRAAQNRIGVMFIN